MATRSKRWNGNVGLRFGDSEFLLYGKNLLDKHLNYGDLYANGFERLEPLGGLEQEWGSVAAAAQREMPLTKNRVDNSISVGWEGFLMPFHGISCRNSGYRRHIRALFMILFDDCSSRGDCG